MNRWSEAPRKWAPRRRPKTTCKRLTNSTPTPLPPIVSYLRVSTVRQGQSGLGIDAQREAVRIFAKGRRVNAEVVETESGRPSDRPELAHALALCQQHSAVLVVAKLDRLARNVALLAKLMEGAIDIHFCDMPSADRFQLDVLAAVGEFEQRQIGARPGRHCRQYALAAGSPTPPTPQGQPDTAADGRAQRRRPVEAGRPLRHRGDEADARSACRPRHRQPVSRRKTFERGRLPTHREVGSGGRRQNHAIRLNSPASAQT
jgi:DNA invertase Pin-like site-specific DNA recombinase